METERLILRPWRTSDALVQRELWLERDPRVPAHRRVTADGHPTVEELTQRIRDGAQPGLRVVELKGTGEVVGYCGLIDNDHGPVDEPELAFELLRRFWRRGYATEASEAVIARAREEGRRRLWASVRDWNSPSRRVLEKLGFVETDRVERDAVHGDSLLTTKRL